MCFSDAARVPEPPVSGEVASSGDLELTAADGNRFMAYEAHPAAPRGIGLVILPDVRGLHQYYKDLADRFAMAGIDTVSIDYFGRTAGIGDRSEAFEYRPHVDQTTHEGVSADTAAAVAHLRSDAGGAVSSVFTVGFCFGGSCSWNQAAAGHDLAGSIGFYGRPERSEALIDEMKNPLLILIAGADRGIPAEAYAKFDEQLNEANVPHEMRTYDGAPHSFFDRTFAEWGNACDDSWQQMLSFIDRHASVAAR